MNIKLLFGYLGSLWLGLAALQQAAAMPKAFIIELTPWGMSEGKRVSGHYAEMARRLSAEMKIPLDLVLRPYARAQAEMKDNDVSFTFMADNPDIRQFAIPISHIGSLSVAIIYQSEMEVTSLADLSGKRIAKINGTRLLNDFNDIPNVDLYSVTNPVNQLLVLLNDKVDAVVGFIPNWVHAKAYLPEADQNRIPFENIFMHSAVPFYIWVPKQSQETDFADRLKRASDHLLESGYYATFIQNDSSYLSHP